MTCLQKWPMKSLSSFLFALSLLAAGCAAESPALGGDEHAGHDHGDDDHGEDDHAGHDHGDEDHGDDDHAGHDHGDDDHAGHDHGDDDHAGHDHANGEHEEAHVDWCAEHALPESACTACNPGLIEAFQTDGDWCEEHGFPESVCPICRPQPAPAGASALGTVHLTDSALAGTGIRLQAAALGAVAVQVDVPAEIQFNPDQVAHVSSLVSGQIQAVEVAVGDSVAPDQPMIELNSVELGQARAELSRARSMLDVAEQNRERQERLRAEGISSERSYLEAELAYEQAQAERDAASSRLRVFGVRGGSGPSLTLQSPIGGVVVERHATRGENVSPDETLLVVADVSSVWVIGRVYEQQIAGVTPGMRATLTLSAYPGREWSGRVDFVGMALDEGTRTLPIRVELQNPDGALRPGLFGTLALSSDTTARSSALVPLDAVQDIDGVPVVFVEGDHAGEYVATRVALGPQDATRVEVEDGLTPGQRVVVEGAFALKSELLRGDLGDGCASH